MHLRLHQARGRQAVGVAVCQDDPSGHPAQPRQYCGIARVPRPRRSWKEQGRMAERTPDTHWRVSPLRSNPIIGPDLRAGTLERYIVVLQALFCGLRCVIAVTIRGLAWSRTTCGSFFPTSTVAVGVAA